MIAGFKYPGGDTDRTRLEKSLDLFTEIGYLLIMATVKFLSRSSNTVLLQLVVGIIISETEETGR